MSKLSSVDKIKSLTQQIESVTGKSHSNLTVAIQALKDGYENDSGSSGIIDVTELPRENIDENAVYRVTETIQTEKTEAYRVYNGYVTSLSDIMASMDVPASNMHVYVVDELPTDMKSSDVETFTELHNYLLRTDGKGYMHISGHGVVTLATMFFQDPSYDKGFTENVYAETEDGIYTTLESYKQIESYFVRENGEWKEITAHIISVNPNGCNDVEELSGRYTLNEPIIISKNGTTLNVKSIIKDEKNIPSDIIVDVPCTADLLRQHYDGITRDFFLDKNGEYITELRKGAFAFFDAETVELPEGLTHIPEYCFYKCNDLNISIPEGVENIDNYAFNGCSELSLTSLPDSVTSIGSYAFQFCSKLSITSLPDSVSSIYYYTFDNCNNITSITLPKSLVLMGYNAFSNCENLVSVTFKSVVDMYGGYQFSGCNNLTTINVPWSEGEVAGAPWGATNATINYNYTGE